MEVDHSGADLCLAQESLDRTHVDTVPEELGCETVTKRVAAGLLQYPRGADGSLDLPLDSRGFWS